MARTPVPPQRITVCTSPRRGKEPSQSIVSLISPGSVAWCQPPLFSLPAWNIQQDAAVVAGEDPCVLLVSACHERGKLLLLGIDATRRVVRQPQRRGVILTIGDGEVTATPCVNRYRSCLDAGHHRELGSADEVCGGRLWKSRRCGALHRRRSGAAAPRSRRAPGRYRAA